MLLRSSHLFPSTSMFKLSSSSRGCCSPLRDPSTNYTINLDDSLSDSIAFKMVPSPDDPSQSNSGLEGNVVVLSSLNLSDSRFESLSWRLGHFDHVLDALNELRSEFFTENQHILPDNEYRLSASRVMDLLDIAKGTLEKVGVNLWPHSLCVVGLRRHKKAYFALLKLLRSRESCLNSQMQARSRRLTCRLSTNFSIRVNPVYDLYLPPMPRNLRQNIGQIQPLHQKALLFRSMPPPDAFPPSDFTPVSSHSFFGPQRRRRRMRLEFSNDIWESLEMEPLSHPSPYIVRHRPGMKKQRFGIFCTGKSSSKTNSRKGRLRAPISI
ncbi:uncharacterized protein C8R40DRAFT_568544 [Lentinula edodes]|uniref:uncharacterized protein n=1 Tax=Lentinula edodes TaxID=5353 RepID=UPI001E8CAB4A|nr:uncharacterized protein C8R40DRAFT_568544 [Lentinula edodes]KAH7871121.1 hypothetical protein C8R40DRAFT_568544 [Lentinula edodes]